jgi:hypothetical protein
METITTKVVTQLPIVGSVSFSARLKKLQRAVQQIFIPKE